MYEMPLLQSSIMHEKCHYYLEKLAASYNAAVVG